MRQVENLERRRNAAIDAANRMDKAAQGKKGKKGDEKKSKQVAQKRKQVLTMGFQKTETGQKWKVSGERARGFTRKILSD